MKNIYIGTSGWKYKHWGEKYYPKELKEDELSYYSKEFDTVEVNSSFYFMPKLNTFNQWHKKTGKNFVFSVKMNRYITHRKRLILDNESKQYLTAFLNNTQELKEKLKVILIQLPPSSKSNLERLEEFFKFLKGEIGALKYTPRIAIEFRNNTWFNDDTYKVLKKYKFTLVISSSPDFPTQELFSADFVYIRFHGSKKLFSSKYIDKELEKWSEKIKKYPVKTVYAYFNNDYSAYAIENARNLKSISN